MERKVKKPNRFQIRLRDDMKKWTLAKTDHKEMERRMKRDNLKVNYVTKWPSL